LFSAHKSLSKNIIVISQNIVKNEETKVSGFEYRGLFRIGKDNLLKCRKVLEVRFEVEL